MPHGVATACQTDGARQALYDLGLSHEKTAGVISNIAGAPFSWAGNKLVGLLGRAKTPWVANLAPKARELGTGLAGQMGSWGLLGGGIEAALSDPGDRLKGFGRGFGLGALSGLGWGAGSRLAQRGVGHFIPPGAAASGTARLEGLEKRKALFNLFGKEQPRGLVHGVPAGERAQILGAKALPFAGGMVGSDLAMKAIGQPGMIDLVRGTANKPGYAMPQVYGPMMQGLPLDPQQYYGNPTSLPPASQWEYNQGYG